VPGDLTHEGDAPSLRAVAKKLDEMGSILAVAGNHDCLERDDQVARCLGSGCRREPGGLLDRTQLEQRIAGAGRPRVVLCGHLHVRDSHASGPVLQLAAGALIEAPYDVAVVDVTRAPSGMRVRRRAFRLGPSAGARDPVLAPADETWTYDGAWRVTP
jgi:predicted phosphodiesterase